MRTITLILTACLMALAVATAATAQTGTSTSSTSEGAFDKLSPGNQKIALSLCDAQAGGCTTTSLDSISAMKQHKGWGEIFKEMQASGQIPADVKNLGQLVSGRYQSGTSSGTTITSASGRSQVVGKPEYGNKSGTGAGNSDNARSNYNRGSDSSGSGRGYGYGHGDSSGSSASTGGSGMSQGGGRGK
jgi:hypothetical protein